MTYVSPAIMAIGGLCVPNLKVAYIDMFRVRWVPNLEVVYVSQVLCVSDPKCPGSYVSRVLSVMGPMYLRL